MEEMALEPPKAKKDRYWKSKDVVVISTRFRCKLLSRRNAISKIRSKGMLVALD
jgi:hypothetical protein